MFPASSAWNIISLDSCFCVWRNKGTWRNMGTIRYFPGRFCKPSFRLRKYTACTIYAPYMQTCVRVSHPSTLVRSLKIHPVSLIEYLGRGLLTRYVKLRVKADLSLKFLIESRYFSLRKPVLICRYVLSLPLPLPCLSMASRITVIQ